METGCLSRKVANAGEKIRGTHIETLLVKSIAFASFGCVDTKFPKDDRLVMSEFDKQIIIR